MFIFCFLLLPPHFCIKPGCEFSRMKHPFRKSRYKVAGCAVVLNTTVAPVDETQVGVNHQHWWVSGDLCFGDVNRYIVSSMVVAVTGAVVLCSQHYTRRYRWTKRDNFRDYFEGCNVALKYDREFQGVLAIFVSEDQSNTPAVHMATNTVAVA